MAIAGMTFITVTLIYGMITWVQVNKQPISVQHNSQSNSSGIPTESMYNYNTKAYSNYASLEYIVIYIISLCFKLFGYNCT